MDLVSQQDLAPAHIAKPLRTGLKTTVFLCLVVQPTPDRHHTQLNTDELKAVIKTTWASLTPQQCNRLILSMPH